MTTQLSLITSDLADTLAQAFAHWCAAQQGTQRTALGESSLRTYRYIWQSYAQFLVRIDTPLQSVEVDDLELFLQSLAARDPFGEEINEHYAWRALSLINRVTVADARRAGEAPNPAARTLLGSERFRYTNARGNEPLPQTLTPKVARRLIQQLTADAASVGLKPTWKTERDRACLALMLGSGLTPMELRLLTGRSIHYQRRGGRDEPWKLTVAATPKTISHDAPIAGWARRCLTRWLTVREAQGFANSDVLFPGTAQGLIWTDVGCQAAATKAMVTLLGDPFRYGGLMRLRHTFVTRQLRKHTPLEQIARWMGIRDLDRMHRYRMVMTHDVDVA
ncbi:MAG: hypothetical protein WA888_06880 [Burkholderiaceae bacterium]